MKDPTFHFSPELLSRLASELDHSSLAVVVKPEWGSRSGGSHRLAIRQGLAATLAPSSAIGSVPWLNDLDILPSHPGKSMSISHALDQGGFAVCDASEGQAIGFDLEKRSRLLEPVVQRISTVNERAQAPDARFLWVAKEATFKGLRGPAQPEVLTQISIGNWAKLATVTASGVDLYRFTARPATAASAILNPSAASSKPDHPSIHPAFTLVLGRGLVLVPSDPLKDEIYAFFARN